ncbi:hypothetical protein CBOM_06911 [Ceraceosorus bombacis]|uniref:Uncharacterized protein n=1 Tax=Ceraceosorus bombacis TaxID=401625 RepID=A0A0P1BTF9_9BASI|nr:hypothetical protein CBOM_06911 [Ceraceosorus bombacis]
MCKAAKGSSFSKTQVDVGAHHNAALAGSARHHNDVSMLLRRVQLKPVLTINQYRPLADDEITFAENAFDHVPEHMKSTIPAQKKIIREQINRARQRPGQDKYIQSYHVIKSWHRPRPGGPSVILGQGRHASGKEYDGATVIPWQHDKKAEIHFDSRIEYGDPESMPLEQKVMKTAIHDHLQWHDKVKHYKIKGHEVIAILKQHWPTQSLDNAASASSTTQRTNQRPVTLRSKATALTVSPSLGAAFSGASKSPKRLTGREARERLWRNVGRMNESAREKAKLELERSRLAWQKSLLGPTHAQAQARDPPAAASASASLSNDNSKSKSSVQGARALEHHHSLGNPNVASKESVKGIKRPARSESEDDVDGDEAESKSPTKKGS